MTIWDTAGQERFQFVSKMYYRMADGFTLVYDITDRASFDDLKYWINEIEQKANNCKVILLGNKWDLEDKRQVAFDEGEAFAKEYGMEFFETSAKENININKVHEVLVKSILEDMKEPIISHCSHSLRNFDEKEENNEGGWDNGW